MSIKSNKYFRFFTNKYVAILLIFGVWMVFFDGNSLLNRNEFDKEIDKLKQDKEYYLNEIEKDKSLIKKLEDKEELEKFAREEYHMKKDNEEIYLIERDSLEKH